MAKKRKSKTIDMVKNKAGSYVAGKAIATAGQSLTKKSGLSSALKVAGSVAKKALPIVAGATLAYGAYSLADKYLFKGKLPLGAKAQGEGKRYRRINPLNYKAATRATKRIKGAMDMLKRIEKQLPKTRVKSSFGSRGVITSREAMSALAR